MKIFEVEFYSTALPNKIVFALNRQAIWAKYPGDVKKIHRIIIN